MPQDASQLHSQQYRSDFGTAHLHDIPMPFTETSENDGADGSQVPNNVAQLLEQVKSLDQANNQQAHAM